MSERTSDVAVVGGGAAGCAVAYFLAREGLRVALFDRGDVAGQASGAAAGMLAPLGEAESPGPLLDWGLWSLARFPALAAELAERSGIDPELVCSGLVHAALDEAEERRLRARLARLPDAGLEWLDPSAAREAEPALVPDLRGALFSPREAHVRSPLLVRALARAAEGLGARVRPGVPVHGLARAGERVTGVETAEGCHAAEQVVLCAGSWTRACAAWAGLPEAQLPVEPVRGQIACADAPAPAFRAILWGPDGLYLVPKADGSVVIGATTERVGFDRRVTLAGLRGLLDAAPRLAPGMAEARFRSAWAGLRPESADGLPLIGPVPGAPGLAVAAGHYRNGVLLAPATGRLVADGVLGKGWGEPAFLPERFSGGGSATAAG